MQASSCPDRGTSRCVTTGRVRHQPLIGPASARVPSFPAVPFLSMARLRWLWLNCRNSRQSPKYGPDPTSHDRKSQTPAHAPGGGCPLCLGVQNLLIGAAAMRPDLDAAGAPNGGSARVLPDNAC